MRQNPDDYIKFSKAWHFGPQEEMLEVKKKKNNLIIGIPLETTYDENRVALAPEAAALLCKNGHTILLQSKAGDSAFFPDHEYAEAGCEIVYSAKEVFQADIIMKVAPLSDQELEYIRPGHVIFSTVPSLCRRRTTSGP